MWENLITPTQLADALHEQRDSGKRLGALLLERGALSEPELGRALSRQLGIPTIDLSDQRPVPEAAHLLPERVARERLAVPVDGHGGSVTIAVADPTAELLAALTEAVRRPVQLAIAPRADIQRAINSAYDAPDDTV